MCRFEITRRVPANHLCQLPPLWYNRSMNETERIGSFAPVADSRSETLILGSIPGAESLRKQQYYGFERNAFWRVMFVLLDEPPTDDYEEKKRVLLRHGIALWDVIESCERAGSLDANIKNAKANDFASFFAAHPRIRRVFFNGQKAHNTFKRQVGMVFDGISFTALGSTSPAHAVPFEKRIADWRQICE